MADIASNLPIRTLNNGSTDPAEVTVGVLDSGGALISPAKDTSVTGLQVSQGASLSGVKGGLVLASVLAGDASYTAAQVSPLVMTATGHLLIKIAESITVTVDGTVTSNQGTAAALSSAWAVKVTDGTNTMPTMDVVSRPGFVKVTDGTNTLPAMDAAARAGFQKITDGSNVAAVKAASTLPAASDTALVTTIRDTVNVNITSSVASAPVADFQNSSGIANAGIGAGLTATHTYLSIATNNFILENIFASASGKLKIEVQIGPAGSEVSKWVAFNSTADTNILIPCGGFKVPAGDNILVIKTNEENAKAQNLYSTIVGENV